eukprot:351542-Chlamydomonas_euryale.AAC.4
MRAGHLQAIPRSYVPKILLAIEYSNSHAATVVVASLGPPAAACTAVCVAAANSRPRRRQHRPHPHSKTRTAGERLANPARLHRVVFSPWWRRGRSWCCGGGAHVEQHSPGVQVRQPSHTTWIPHLRQRRGFLLMHMRVFVHFPADELSGPAV